MADPESGRTRPFLDATTGDDKEDPKLSDETTARPRPSPGLLARLRHLEARMDKKLGVESDAIERKRAEDRQQAVPWHEQLSMALLWASGTMNTSCFATGFLGRGFGLDLRQTLLITILVSMLGGAVVGAAATFGAATGLRQMSVSRFSFGWWPSKVIAVLNCIQQLGWAAVSCITGGLALTAVSDGRVSLVLGIVILAVVAWFISVVGLNAILVYERYAWIIFFVIFLIIFGETGRYADNTTPATATGANLAGGVLSLIAVVYGSSASWATVASDYYVHYHADVSRVKVFFMTAFGIAIPTSIGMVAGCVVSSALNLRPDWDAAYQRGLGYVIQESLYPRGFAKFLLTLLVLSGINTNVIGIYSAALSFQQISRPFSLVPRFLWMLLSLACILALALGGREELNQYLQSFLSLLGYWCTSYIVIILEEHYVFRKARFASYDLDGWNTPSQLPHGIGAAVAFGLGVVAWCMGMSQTWFIGPLARLIGDNGGDVANEFTFVVTALSYLPARYLELKFCFRRKFHLIIAAMDKIDRVLYKYAAEGHDTKDKVYGASFVVTDRNGVVYSGSSGRISAETSSAPFTDKSFSWVASLTKLLTATALLQLVEDGKLTLDQDLRPVVPYLAEVQILVDFDDKDKPVMEENKNPITLRQLLTHTAGFSYEFADPLLLKWSRQQKRPVWRMSWSREEVSTPLRFAPGESWGYGVNTDWAGLVLEAVTGRTLNDYMGEHIFRPLGMSDSGFRRAQLPQTARRTVRAAVRNPKTGELDDASTWVMPTDHEVDSGGGGLFTTAHDYAAFLRGLLAAKVLKSGTVQEMLRPQLDDAKAGYLEVIAFHPSVHKTFAPEFTGGPIPLNHGLGGLVNMVDVPGKRRAGSMAWSGMHNCRWWIDAKTGIAAVLVVNIRPNGDPVVAKLYDELELATYEALASSKSNM
ncbi:hypothetical protein ARSEF1564_005840 [Beauveria bassiana]